MTDAGARAPKYETDDATWLEGLADTIMRSGVEYYGWTPMRLRHVAGVLRRAGVAVPPVPPAQRWPVYFGLVEELAAVFGPAVYHVEATHLPAWVRARFTERGLHDGRYGQTARVGRQDRETAASGATTDGVPDREGRSEDGGHGRADGDRPDHAGGAAQGGRLNDAERERTCINCAEPFIGYATRHWFGAHGVGPLCEQCDRVIKTHTLFRGR